MDTTKITVGGQEIDLTPTVGAIDALNKRYDNLQAVYARVGTMDLEAYANVLFVGQEARLPKNEVELKEAKQIVYETGIVNLMVPLIDFLGLLTNGGKRRVAEEENDTNPKM